MSNVAQTILQQLGGNRFIAMTGAKNLTVGDYGNGLGFKIGRNAGRVSHVQIHLDASDTYTVKFLAVRKFAVREIESASFVYADQLRPMFERVTGMATSL